MRTADGGGYGGHWSRQNVKGLWPMLENQDTDAHWRHVAGWQKAYELTSQHLARMKRYREGLVAAWPPERSEAARAYVERLDFLIDTVQRTHDTAVANHETFRAATLAIGASRRELKDIHDRYVATERIKHEHEARLAANPAARGSDRPPVTDQDLATLNQNAQTVMSRLSGELSLAQIRIQQPPTYKGMPDRSNEDPSSGSGSGGPPLLPAIAPVSITELTSRGQSSLIRHSSTPTSSARGPALSSTAGPLTPTIPSAIYNPPSSLPPTNSSTQALPPNPASYPRSHGTSTLPTKPTASITPTTGATAPSSRSMPPGGVIGGVPSATAAGGPTPVRKANPAGGVIGEQCPPPRRAINRSLAGSPQSFLAYGSENAPPISNGAIRKEGGKTEDGWDSDNPWETTEGGNPVLTTPSEPKQADPGPAIGLSR
jgi:hypothetical protein